MSETPGATWADDAHRYRLDSRIATGGMGEVWRGTDTTLGRTVAVKLLKAEYADDETFRSRFSTEAQHAAALHHPGVAAVYDFGEAVSREGTSDGSPRPYLVMELVDGQPLSALIRPGQPLDPDVTRDLMTQAAAAIGAAHAAGIVHRDVKPANLIVTPDGTVKITDFGIARALEGMALTQTGQVMGTPQYISPEQAQGSPATPASDVYSLGVVAFECLTSERPFVRETPVATALAHVREPVPPLPDGVPADLAAVVTRSMAKDPTERYADAAELAAALRDPSAAAATAVVPAAGAATSVMPAVAGAAAAAPTPTSSAPVPPPEEEKRSLPWLWVVLAVVVLVAIIAFAAVALTGGDDEPADDPAPSQTTRDRQTRTPEETATEEQSPTQETPEETATSQEPDPTPTETTEPTQTSEPTQTQTPDPTATATQSPTGSGSDTGAEPAPDPTATATGSGAPTTVEEDQ